MPAVPLHLLHPPRMQPTENGSDRQAKCRLGRVRCYFLPCFGERHFLSFDNLSGSSPFRVGKRDAKSGSDGGVGQGFGHVRGARNLA